MKSIFLSTLFVCAIYFTASATIWRVNNNAGLNANFTTMAAAVAGAANGDTIYLEPSGTTYGGASINKKLVIIGNGSFLPQHPGLQNNTQNSLMGVLYMQPGSENSMISGIYFTDHVYLYAQNILFTRCRIESGYILNVLNSNQILTQNWLYSLVCDGSNLGNLVISNNVVFLSLTMSANSSAIIENNVIGYHPSSLLNLGAANCTVRNNTIFAFSQGTNSVFHNNISVNGGLPAGNGNQNNVALADIFVGPINGTNDANFQLKVGSPAIDAGYYGGGDDIGAFNNGIDRPTYVLGLIPAFPTIYDVNLGTQSNSSLNVTISTRSNN